MIFPAQIIRVIDGATVLARVDLGFNIFTIQKFQVKDFQVPQAGPEKSEKEIEHYEVTRQFAISILKDLHCHVKTYKTANFNEYTADIYLSDNRNYADVMRSHGYERRESY